MASRDRRQGIANSESRARIGDRVIRTRRQGALRDGIDTGQRLHRHGRQTAREGVAAIKRVHRKFGLAQRRIKAGDLIVEGQPGSGPPSGIIWLSATTLRFAGLMVPAAVVAPVTL